MKNIVSFALSVILILSFCVIPAFAADEDTNLNISEEQFGILRITGAAIEDSVNGIPDEPIIRGVAARRFAAFGNFSFSAAKDYEALFYDLSTDNYFYYYIKGCYDNGVMNGYPDGTFRPDNYISTLEAAKVLLYTIGYKDYVEAAGIQKAMNTTHLLDGISEISDAMTYGDFYRMMYNAYMAPYCRVVSYKSNGGIECQIDENYTALEHLHKIRKGNGVVDGATATTLEWPDDSMLDNMISIDGERYMFNEGNSTDYLGYNVDFYYKIDQNNKTNGNEIVYICKTEKNRTMEFTHDQLEGFSDYKLKYVKNNRIETAEITPTTLVIYNGVACPTYTSDDIVPVFGKVTLIDNDRKNAGYEVVLVENHEFYIVDTFDTVKLRVKDVNEDIPVLSMENADVVNIKKNGNDYPAERITKGELLKVQRTKPDCGYYVCNIEVFKNEKNNVTVIKANEDAVWESVHKHPVWEDIDRDSRTLLKAGSVVTLYMYNGTVVRVTSENKNVSEMGYLMNVATEGTISKDISARIMLSSAEASIFKLAKKVKLDENIYSDENEIMAYLAQTAQISVRYASEAPYAQPVRFRTNADGVIVSIDTMCTDEKENAETCLTLSYPLADDVDITDKGYYYRAFSNGAFYNDYHVATFKSMPIKVPLDGSLRLDDKNYIATVADARYYPVEIFNLETPINLAECGIIYTGTAGSNAVTYSNNHDPVIIYAKNAELNVDGEVDYSLDAYYRTTTRSYKYRAEDLAKFEALALCDVGDVVQIHEDKYGYIDGINMVYDVSEFIPAEKRLFTWGAGGNAVPVNDGYKALYTVVVDSAKNFIRTTTSNPLDDTGLQSNYQGDTFVPDAGTVYKYTNVRGEVAVEQATVDDIVTYEQSNEDFTPVIFIHNNNSGGLNNMYIISK